VSNKPIGVECAREIFSHMDEFDSFVP
jgi:hypothetical protein